MDTSHLHHLLLTAFSETDLKKLCLPLRVTYEDLPGPTRREKAAALMAVMQKQGQLLHLKAEMSQVRPQLFLGEDAADRLSWIDEVAASWGQANQPQITSQANQLKDIHEPQKGGPQTNVPRLRRNPPPEMPTSSWITVDEQRAAVQPRPGKNPYHAGRIVTEKAMFFGREEERQQVRVRLQNNGSVSIVGMRRIGTSSLLYYLSHHEELAETGQRLFAYLNLRESRYHTLPGLLNGALSQWTAVLEQEDVPPINGLADFCDAIERLTKQGYHLVLCLDAFAQLTKRPEQFDETLLACWQALGSSGQLVFLTSSHQPIPDLLKQGGLNSSFGDLFMQIDLGLLDEISALALVREPAQQNGINFPTTAVDELLLLGGTHPFFLQMAAHHLVNQLQLGGYQAAQLKQDFLHEAEPYWRRLWEELLPLQQKLLAEVMQPDPPLVIKRQFRQLERRGVLREEAGVYQPFSAAFGAWLDAELHAKTTPTRMDQASQGATWLGKFRGLLDR